MIAGHLEEKKGFLYMVLNLHDEQGKRRQKWVATHLPVKGNKKRAEEMLLALRQEYTAKQVMADRSRAVFFDAFLLSWLESRWGKVEPTTFSSYQNLIQKCICPYFRERAIPLYNLKAQDIQDFYDAQYVRGVSGNTVLHYHVLIRKALDDAVNRDLIPLNPTDRMERPKKEQYVADCYSVEECNRLIQAVKGEKLELPIMLALFYGLRRSEVLGLRWGAIDFEGKTLAIVHSVSFVQEDGHYILKERDKVKRKSSFRTLPLVEGVEELLKKEVKRRYRDALPCPDDYICVDEKGELFRPNYVTQGFTKLLKKHGLRQIRFHDLRHSCANVLISNRVPLIEVQQWLGHSNISTTADIYSHLAYETKLASADTLKKTSTYENGKENER